MRVFFDNVDLNSNSGPNSFGRRLCVELQQMGHVIAVTPTDPCDAQLSFIRTTRKEARRIALRLDGIYFNTRQDWLDMNRPLSRSHEEADVVIYQSNFNKRLTEKYFGQARSSVVINNGTCLDTVSKIHPSQHHSLDKFSEVWSCSSMWRPHKRLRDNVNYFLEQAPQSAGLVVAGSNPDYVIQHPRVVYAGQQTWQDCIALYKRSNVFLHLAFLDHCPNVVVDARASGCRLVVASSGGTREIAGPDASVVEDMEWDMSPLDLYDPPALTFCNASRNGIESSVDIRRAAAKYAETLELSS